MQNPDLSKENTSSTGMGGEPYVSKDQPTTGSNLSGGTGEPYPKGSSDFSGGSQKMSSGPGTTHLGRDTNIGGSEDFKIRDPWDSKQTPHTSENMKDHIVHTERGLAAKDSSLSGG
jgi:hypothetical protein